MRIGVGGGGLLGSGTNCGVIVCWCGVSSILVYEASVVIVGFLLS